MLLKINTQGKVIQADGTTDTGEGSSSSAPPVEESTVVLNPQHVLHEQNKIKRIALMGAQQESNRRAFNHRLMIEKNKADHIRRKMIMSGQADVPTKNEILILKEHRKHMMRNMMGYADFDEFEQMKANTDFGGMDKPGVDYGQNSVYSNPLVPRGTVGPVSDWARYVAAPPFNNASTLDLTSQGGVSMGSLGTMMPDRPLQIRRSSPQRKVRVLSTHAHPLAGFMNTPHFAMGTRRYAMGDDTTALIAAAADDSDDDSSDDTSDDDSDTSDIEELEAEAAAAPTTTLAAGTASGTTAAMTAPSGATATGAAVTAATPSLLSQITGGLAKLFIPGSTGTTTTTTTAANNPVATSGKLNILGMEVPIALVFVGLATVGVAGYLMLSKTPRRSKAVATA